MTQFVFHNMLYFTKSEKSENFAKEAEIDKANIQKDWANLTNRLQVLFYFCKDLQLLHNASNQFLISFLSVSNQFLISFLSVSYQFHQLIN